MPRLWGKMKDFLDFEITTRLVTENETEIVLRHETRPIKISLKIPKTVHAASLPDIVNRIMSVYSKRYRSVMQKPLTKSQKEVYDCIISFYRDHHRAPTYEEIGALIDVSKGTVYHYIQKLVARGWIWIDEKKPVPIEIAQPEQVN